MRRRQPVACVCVCSSHFRASVKICSHLSSQSSKLIHFFPCEFSVQRDVSTGVLQEGVNSVIILFFVFLPHLSPGGACLYLLVSKKGFSRPFPSSTVVSEKIQLVGGHLEKAVVLQSVWPRTTLDLNNNEQFHR